MGMGFPVVVGGPESLQDLVFAGKYDLHPHGMEQFFYGYKHWRVKPADVREDILIPVTFADHIYPRAKQVLRVFRKLGLKRPSVEHALRFGIAYPEEQRRCPHVFLHEFWISLANRAAFLVLEGNSVGRRLDFSEVCFPRNAGNVFMGVKT